LTSISRLEYEHINSSQVTVLLLKTLILFNMSTCMIWSLLKSVAIAVLFIVCLLARKQVFFNAVFFKYSEQCYIDFNVTDLFHEKCFKAYTNCWHWWLF